MNGMTPEQIQLVQRTIGLIVPDVEAVATLFYARLFTLDRTLRSLFRRDMEEQGKKLMATLALVAYSLDRPGQFLPLMYRLGQRHVGYGVQPEDYRRVGEALLWALGEASGPAFTPEVKEAWAAAYNVMAGAMQEGAVEVAPYSGLSRRPKAGEEGE